MISRSFVTVIIQNILWSKGIPHIANLSKSKVSERLQEMKKKGRGISKGNNERDHGRDKKGNGGH